VTAQLARLTQGLDLPTPAKDAFTEAQLSMLPENLRGRMKVHFCAPTGSDAVDAAIKLCKTATGRRDVVSFQGGFHGSTHGAMAVTGLIVQKEPIANGVPGVHFFPYSYCARCPLGLAPSTCDTNCVAYLEQSLRDGNGGVPLPAAVIMELVQGEGGVVPVREEFARRVRALTRELGIPLIVDEVQTGCGRTGTWFAFEQYGIEPDVIVASKALSGIGLWIKGNGTGIMLAESYIDVSGARTTLYPTTVTWQGWHFAIAQLPAGMQFPLTISFVDFLAISPSQTTGGSLNVSGLQALYAPGPWSSRRTPRFRRTPRG
jgi:4-aminobutyrate aminotransferase-like enzyme